MIKQALIVVILLGIAVIAFIFYTNSKYQETKLSNDPAERASQLQVRNFSLAGTIFEIKPDSLVVQTTQVIDGKKQYKNVGVTLNVDGKLNVVENGVSREIQSATWATELKVGDQVTIFGAGGNPYKATFIFANRIDVMR